MTPLLPNVFWLYSRKINKVIFTTKLYLQDFGLELKIYKDVYI